MREIFSNTFQVFGEISGVRQRDWKQFARQQNDRAAARSRQDEINLGKYADRGEVQPQTFPAADIGALALCDEANVVIFHSRAEAEQERLAQMKAEHPSAFRAEI